MYEVDIPIVDITPEVEVEVSSDSPIETETDLVVNDGATDYEKLTHKPQIEGVELKGNKSLKDLSITPMYFATTAEWAQRTDLVSEENAFYIWTDYKVVGGENIAGVKIGDGLAYVLDLPFLDAQFQSHAADTDIHVTSAEKAFWNAKNRGFVTDENLILTDL